MQGIGQALMEQVRHVAGFIESRTYRSFEVYAVICAVYFAMAMSFKALFAIIGMTPSLRQPRRNSRARTQLSCPGRAPARSDAAQSRDSESETTDAETRAPALQRITKEVLRCVRGTRAKAAGATVP